MSVELRIPRRLLEEIRGDLARKHPFALERVGFLFTRRAAGARPLILGSEYVPLANDEYLEDDKVGALISGGAIRRMLQRALSTQQGAFHVHEHGWPGRPGFSPTDEQGLASLLPSFCGLLKKEEHGALLLSPDQVIARVWRFGQPVREATAVTVVGFPMQRWERDEWSDS